MKRTAAIVMVGVLLAAAPVRGGEPQERRTTLADQEGVAVTIYNEDLALVKDRRRMALDAGEGRLAFREVSARIRPETALLRSITHPSGFFVREQNFDFDLLTPEALLQKYVGRTVRVVKTHPQTGAETEVEAQVLSAAGGTVLKIGNRIETGVPGRLVYPDVPETLRDRPTLVIDLVSPTPHPQELELSYLTGGLSWHADYVAELSPAGEALSLSGWVTLTNASGTRYPAARLQLVAGNVNRVREEFAFRKDFARPDMAMAPPAPAVKEESLFEYHLYTLERPTTLRENQTKQVALLSVGNVPVRREYLLRGMDYYYGGRYGDLGRKLKVGVFLEFVNSERGGLGVPLPAGVVRVYQRDSAGGAQFVGEDRLDHTPRNEKVRLKMGDAFDVTADRTQTDFRKVSGGETTVLESAFRVEIRNAKKEKVTVKVAEPMPGDWKVVQENLPHRKEDAGSAVWNVTVPADGKATLEYRVRVKF